MGHKGTRFATMEDIKSNATAKLRKIPKEAFHRCFQQWQDRWSKCVCVRKSPTVNMGLKGTRFATMENIKSNVTAELWKIPIEAFHGCFQQWQDRWSKCVCVCVFVRARVCVRACCFEGD
jgi:hypothetical protein